MGIFVFTLCLSSIPFSAPLLMEQEFHPIIREPKDLVPSQDIMRNFDFYINSHNYTARSIPQGKGDGIYGAFDVISGSPIDFFIITEANLTLWKDGNDTLRYELQEQILEAQWEMILPDVGPWVLVFDNQDDSEAHIRGTEYQDITPPSITSNVDNNGWYPTPCWVRFVIEDEMFFLANWSVYIGDTWIEGASYGLDSQTKGAISDGYFNVSYLELPFGWFNFTINVVDTASNEGAGHVNIYIYDPAAITTTSPTSGPPTTTNGLPDSPPDIIPFLVTIGAVGIIAAIVVGVAYWKSLGDAEAVETASPKKKTHRDRKDYVKGKGRKRKKR
jgi:hypothetical protein